MPKPAAAYVVGAFEHPTRLAPDTSVDYLNLRLRHLDTTDAGGCSYLMHVHLDPRWRRP